MTKPITKEQAVRLATKCRAGDPISPVDGLMLLESHELLRKAVEFADANIVRLTAEVKALRANVTDRVEPSER